MNKTLFQNPGRFHNIPVATEINRAGGKAYAYSDKQALAQIACSGTFNGTYYADGKNILSDVKDLVNKLKDDPKFIAQVALYAREKGHMKDLPAYLTAVLYTLDKELFKKVFPVVIDNGKMLRNAVKIARSGELGKVYNLSAGTWRKTLDAWFDQKSSEAIFRASVGNDPSMKQIIKMARPKPKTKEKEALFGYLIGKVKDGLPEVVSKYEDYKKNKGEIPNVDFRLLDSLGLGKDEWTQVALNAGWQMLRMNLNTFARHGVFEDKDVVAKLAQKLKDRESIKKARVFPYQLLIAYKNTQNVPFELREALQDAMEIAVENTPTFEEVNICVDVSGSMSFPVTGRSDVSSKVRCIDVAAFFASSIIRTSPKALVLPFDTAVHSVSLNPRDSILTNADKLVKYKGGGTNCAIAMETLNFLNKTGHVVFISDNESWVGDSRRATGLMTAWRKYKSKNHKAKLVCIDIAPSRTSQVKTDKDILQVSGFSDTVYEVINNFFSESSEDFWLKEVEKVEV